MVKLLVNANALVDKANQKGTTALMRATQEGNEEVVGILVAAGADVSKRNNERMNALMLGSQVRHLCCTHAWKYMSFNCGWRHAMCVKWLQ